MELSHLVFLAIGFGAGIAAVVATLRRAKKKPDGKSAKAIEIMGGGGPGTGELPK